MKPTQVQIETQVDTCREVLRRGGHLGIEGASLVSLADDVETFKREMVTMARQAADRIAELERAAETTRAEHAAALGIATARIRELEGAFAELAALFPTVTAPPDDDTCEEDDSTCGKCGRLCTVDDGAEFERGDPCHPCAQDSYAGARAIVARIEKATKGTT